MPLTKIKSLGITDGTVLAADIADGTISLAKLSATGTKDSTTFLRGDNSFATVSSDYVLLATTDASSSASVSFDGYFSSTYKNYKIIISGLKPDTDNTEFYVRFRSSNSVVSSSNYTYAQMSGYVQSNSSQGSGGGGGYNINRIILFDNADSGASEQSFLECTLFDPLATDSFKNIIVSSFQSNNDASQWSRMSTGGRLRVNASTALSGLTFTFSSGNIASGNFKLYGIK